MDAETLPPIPPVADGAEPTPAVAQTPPPDAAGTVAAGTDAADIAAAHGGQSGELSGAELAKLRDRIRKWKKNHPGETHPQQHLVPPPSVRRVPKDPPPIPSAASPAAPPVGPVAGAPVSDAPPPVAWTEAELAEIIAELIVTLEEWDKTSDVKKARALNLGGKLLEQIEADAGIPKFCATVWKKYLPRLAAKWLNKSGVSSEYEAETALALSALYYLYDKSSRHRAMKRLAQPATHTEATKGTE